MPWLSRIVTDLPGRVLLDPWVPRNLTFLLSILVLPEVWAD